MANPNPLTGHLKRDAGPGRPKGSQNKLRRERIEKELKFIALSNIMQAFERIKGTRGSRATFTLRELWDMPEELQRCIASIKVRTENLTTGDKAQDTTVEIKLWDKVRALELCARALGMLKDQLEVTASPVPVFALPVETPGVSIH